MHHIIGAYKARPLRPSVNDFSSHKLHTYTHSLAYISMPKALASPSHPIAGSNAPMRDLIAAGHGQATLGLRPRPFGSFVGRFSPNILRPPSCESKAIYIHLFLALEALVISFRPSYLSAIDDSKLLFTIHPVTIHPGTIHLAATAFPTPANHSLTMHAPLIPFACILTHWRKSLPSPSSLAHIPSINTHKILIQNRGITLAHFMLASSSPPGHSSTSTMHSNSASSSSPFSPITLSPS